MFMLIDIGLSFLHVMVFKIVLTCFCNQKPRRLPTKKIYESLKRPAAGATFDHLDCLSKNIASTNFKPIQKLDSTNKHRIFWGYFIYSFASMFSFFKFYISQNVLSFFIFLNKDYLYKLIFFYFYFIFSVLYFFILLMYSFLFWFLFVLFAFFICVLIFPYFRGNSLNSRACL